MVTTALRLFHGGVPNLAAVLDRAVLLTHSERRRLLREWTAADLAMGTGS